MPFVVTSKNGVRIRLRDERWAHITDEHSELTGMQTDVLETVAEPEGVFAGRAGECLAIRTVAKDKWLVVVYRESEEDGFIITAFLTRRVGALARRTRLWP